MNKHRTNALLQLLVLFALAAAVVLTLAWPQLPFAKREGEPVEVSVILRQTDGSAWANARLGMEQAAGQLRAEVRLVTLSAENDAAEQARLMGYEAQRGADVLVVIPAGELPADTGVPVITLETPGGEGSVCTDNEALGRALAAAALEDLPACRVLLVNSAPGSAGVSARLEGARATLEAGGAEVEEAQLDPADDGTELETVLAKTEADAVLLFEPSATETAASAKEKLSLAPALYGVGSTSPIAAALEQGTLSASAVWSDFAAGYLAVEGAVHAARGESWQPQTLDFSILRGEDMYEPDNQKLLFPVAS